MSHRALSGTFACVAVSGGEVCLFCVTEKKKQPPLCCLLCNLVISTYCHKHTPLLSGWYMRSDGAACSLCQVIHGHGNTGCIQPRVSPRFAPLLHHHNCLKKRKAKKRERTCKQSFVLILGCREGWASAWEGIGICTGFYCHSILKIHFCHRRNL